MKRRRPTPIQTVMIVLMAVAFAALLAWTIPEVMGVLSPETEDTYSEWVWDLSGWQMLGIAGLHMTAGILFVWSAGHFIEGWKRRRPHDREGD